MMNRWYQPVLLALGTALTLGCASTSEQADLATLRAAIEQNTAAVEEAKRMAGEAEREAASANLTAEQARIDAAAAKSQSQDTESKIDRMFKKAMYK